MYDPIMGRIIVMAWMMSLVVQATAGAGAASGAGAVAADTPTAAELFEAVRQQEAWFTTLPRCWIRLETEVASENGDLSLLEREAASPDQGGTVLPASRFRGGANVCQLAWDENHVAVHVGLLPFRVAEIHDGRRFVQVHANGKWVIRSVDERPNPMAHLTWPHLSSMRQWFAQDRGNLIAPRDVSVEGIERYRGRDCYVLRSVALPRMTRWFIGVEDHRLYGYQSGRSMPLEQLDEFARRAAAEHGVTLTDHRAFTALEDVKVEQRIRRTLNQLTADAGRPHMERWFDDYRKVSGTDGIYPFEQGERIFGASRRTTSGTQQVFLTEGRTRVVMFDTSYIPTGLFNTEPPPGTSVTDRTRLTGHGGLLRPMQYTQPTPSPWRNPANWPKLLMAAISARNLILTAIVGLAAGVAGWGGWRAWRTWRNRRVRRVHEAGT